MTSTPPTPPQEPGPPYGQPPYGPPPYREGWGSDYPPPPATGPGTLAEWWQRLVANILDGFILTVPTWLLTGGMEPIETDAGGDITNFRWGPLLLVIGVSLLITVIYSAVMEGGPRGASVGKMAMKIQVRDADTGGPLGPLRAGQRRLIYSVLFYACFVPGVINGLSPLWDARRQAWHDKAVNSIVIRSG